MKAALSPPRASVVQPLWRFLSCAKALSLLFLSLLAGGVGMPVLAVAGPVESLQNFSEFRSFKPARLLDGEILGERGALMTFPQGICAQTCFAVPVSATEAAQRLQFWDPARGDAPNVLAFSPVRVPCGAADFESLSLKSGDHALRWLLEKSLSTTAGRSELNLSQGEASQLAVQAKDNPDSHGLSTFWAKLLLERASAFQRLGFAGVPPYEAGGKTVSPAKVLRAMLQERPEVAREFAPLLERSGVLGDQPSERLTPFYYWGLCEANRRGTLNLGAVYDLPVGDHHQLLDVQYYVSGVYYACVTLYEVWPIHEGARLGSLVWRGDYFAAPTLAFTKGTDRLAYGAIMLQELKKAVRCFQKNVTANP